MAIQREAKRAGSLASLDNMRAQARQPGQTQSEESAERDRRFAERAAAIEKLKSIRVRGSVAAKPARKAQRKLAKD